MKCFDAFRGSRRVGEGARKHKEENISIASNAQGRDQDWLFQLQLLEVPNKICQQAVGRTLAIGRPLAIMLCKRERLLVGPRQEGDREWIDKPLDRLPV